MQFLAGAREGGTDFLQAAGLRGEVALGGDTFLLAQQIVVAADVVAFDELAEVIGAGLRMRAVSRSGLMLDCTV